MKYLAILGTALALAACGSKPAENAPAEPSTAPAATTIASADAAPDAFNQCIMCHKVEKDGGNGQGPNLHAIVGKKAGSAAGFAYSPAMKDWGQSWTESNLDKFISDPRKMIPGTKMSFAGESDAAKRKAIIDWLKKNQ